VRFWDLAATRPSKEYPDPDFTKGIRVSELRLADGEIGLWVDDVAELRDGPGEVLALMKRVAAADGREVEIATWQDPGQAGKAHVHGIAGVLAGYMLQWIRASRDKVAYAKVWSPLAKAGRIYVKAGQPWTKPLLRSLQKFPYGAHDDDVGAGHACDALLRNRF
jgi:predicted phage terminase large subunit-like protein